MIKKTHSFFCLLFDCHNLHHNPWCLLYWFSLNAHASVHEEIQK